MAGFRKLEADEVEALRGDLVEHSKGLRRREMARDLGVRETYLSQVLGPNGKVTWPMVRQLMEYLGLRFGLVRK